ncbi:predicted protein [Nematostella vectensis]|uniref:Protein FAM76A n=1 Tax=Nematostella vectensis TaxID=45351 RepID=A7RPE7_NEMVE|nr:protein FAM76B [Nematostella vectensis]EDO46673.1 predicted protein [Nematostella vectensis]|eukprot:XP_001638736.1 predicted protein [Nematostella vectensis]
MSLFACTKCHSRHPFEELSRGDQLCKKCRKSFPLVTCTFCRLEFHLLDKTERPVCKKCDSNIKQYGQPTCCVYCNIRAAFNGDKCSRCESSEKKYGTPVLCEQCKLKCAFKKSDESKEKVDGKVLCLLCTLSYKRLVHKSKGKVHGRSSSQHKGVKRSHHHPKHEKKSKVAKLQESKQSSQSSRDSPVTALGLYSASSGNSDTGGEAIMSGQMAELNDLKEQVAKLKRQLQQKDQALLEKEKKLTELKAENWEKEKVSKKKVMSLQKEMTDRIDTLQTENRNLRKQLSSLSRTPKPEKASASTAS